MQTVGLSAAAKRSSPIASREYPRAADGAWVRHPDWMSASSRCCWNSPVRRGSLAAGDCDGLRARLAARTLPGVSSSRRLPSGDPGRGGSRALGADVGRAALVACDIYRPEFDCMMRKQRHSVLRCLHQRDHWNDPLQRLLRGLLRRHRGVRRQRTPDVETLRQWRDGHLPSGAPAQRGMRILASIYRTLGPMMARRITPRSRLARHLWQLAVGPLASQLRRRAACPSRAHHRTRTGPNLRSDNPSMAGQRRRRPAAWPWPRWAERAARAGWAPDRRECLLGPVISRGSTDAPSPAGTIGGRSALPDARVVALSRIP